MKFIGFRRKLAETSHLACKQKVWLDKVITWVVSDFWAKNMAARLYIANGRFQQIRVLVGLVRRNQVSQGSCSDRSCISVYRTNNFEHNQCHDNFILDVRQPSKWPREGWESPILTRVCPWISQSMQPKWSKVTQWGTISLSLALGIILVSFEKIDPFWSITL